MLSTGKILGIQNSKFSLLFPSSITYGFTPPHPPKMGWGKRGEETWNLQVFENLMPKQVKKLVLANYWHPGAGWPWESPLLHCSVEERDFWWHYGHCLGAALTTNSEKPVTRSKDELSTPNLRSGVRENEACPNRGVSSLEKQPLLLLLVMASP